MTDAIKVASKIRSDLFDKHGIVASRLWAKSGVIEDMNRMVSEAIDDAVRAEREACAQQLNDRAEDMRKAETVTANNMARIWDDEAAAIRNRKQEG